VTGREPVPPSGVVEVRLPGDMADILRLTEVLAQTGADVIETRGPRPNRRDPGVRVYMLVRVGQDGGSQ
jgi:hypothetical protein